MSDVIVNCTCTKEMDTSCETKEKMLHYECDGVVITAKRMRWIERRKERDVNKDRTSAGGRRASCSE